MNEPMPVASSPEKSSNTVQPRFRLGRVVGVVAGIMVLVALAFAGVEYVNNQASTYAKVTGRVMWEGKPVTIGAVMTQHTTSPTETAVGGFDSEGKFELMTNGTPGAAVGVHKVIVASYEPDSMGIPLVPAEYLKMATTPLSINVTNDPAKNHFELQVVGEKPKRPNFGRPKAAESETQTTDADPKEDVSPPSDQPAPAQ